VNAALHYFFARQILALAQGGPMSEDDDLIGDIRNAVVERNAYFQELEGESPRAAAILAVASLEDELEKLLLSKFPKSITRQIWKNIAGPTGPLGSYKARNDLARAFGFYGSRTTTTLETIATIRNKFAHRTDVRNFDHPIFQEWFVRLADNPVYPFIYTPKSTADDVRRNFIHTVEEMEKRIASVREYLPELGGPPPDPLP
jgi:hypothetical protein